MHKKKSGVNPDQFTRRLKEAEGRVANLLQRADADPFEQQVALPGVFEELHAAWAELRAAEEELHQQHAELLAAREAMEAERQRYQDLYEFAPDGYLLTDARGIIQEANRAAATLLNTPQPYLIGKPLALFVDTEEVATYRAVLQELKTAEQVQKCEMRLLPRERPPIAGFLIAAATRNYTRWPVAIRWLLHDISERKRAEEMHTFLSAIVESSDDAIIGKRLDGIILSWNAGAERLYGYTAAEVIGQPIGILVPPDRPKELPEILHRITQGERIAHYETVRVRKDGTRMDVSLTISPIKDSVGTIVGASAITRDITERRRLEAQVLQAQKMESIGRLAGGVAHDFNNLMTVITGHAELARAALPDKHPIEGDLSAIEQAADRATSLTQQLLAFARKQILEPRILNLNDLVLDISKLLRRLIGEHITLVTQLAPDLGQIKADPDQLGQVLINLAVNARDAMHNGGCLTIETANSVLDSTYADQQVAVAPGPYVMLAISDTGTGIEAEVQQHIFEPFFTTKEPGKGTGLGLAMCYGIVKQHGGYIWVESDTDRGTIFRIYLPRAMEPATARPERDQPDVLPRGSETVLLVEDEPAVRVLVARMLRKQGYTVLEAADGEKALQVVDEHGGAAIDLLLTDIVMPKMGGRELAGRLSDQYPNLKVLFTSGYPGDTLAQNPQVDSWTDLLQKPFSPATLVRKVRQALDRKPEDD